MHPVLVADNDAAVGGLLADVLARVGLGVGRAHDGCAAIAMARDPAVRVLVCDLDMPGASGQEVIASLADLPRPPAVVVVSGYVDSEVEDELRRWPFVREVLRKPFDVLEFAARVRCLFDDGSAAAADGAAG